MNIQIKKLHPNAKVPSYAHPGDAGMDICCVESITIPPKSRVSIKTGIAIALPQGYVSLLWDKSGLAAKHGITILAGVLDAHYRGEYIVVAYNTTDAPYTFSAGDKVAQILIQKIEQPTIEVVAELDETARSTSGFGSTGK